jgi:hypothetical protein
MRNASAIVSYFASPKALERPRQRTRHPVDDEQSERVSAADIDALRGHLHAIQRQRPQARQCVLHAMIDGIRVDARDQIEPTFRVPAVRIESR